MRTSSNKPAHITKGDVLDDIGFARSEASVLKMKATLLDAILDEIQRRGYSQRQLVAILDEYQPSVSNLVHGKISKVSLEKLLAYSDRLSIRSTLTAVPNKTSGMKTPATLAKRKRIRPSAQQATLSTRKRLA